MVVQIYQQAVPCNHDYSISKKGLYEMTLKGLKRHEGVFGRLVGHDKDLPGCKEAKKSTSITTQLFVALFGAFLLYAIFFRVDYRAPSPESSLENSYKGDFGLCSKSSTSSEDGIVDHYPIPGTHDREECACTPVHYFVVMSMQRSGSGWFETLLNDHPNISSHGEIFSRWERRENFTAIRGTLDTLYNLEWQSSASKATCTAAVGHKWMLNQGVMDHHTEIADYYKGKGVSVVLLLRRNLIKRLISVLANSYDKQHALLNGTHKSHVHEPAEAKVLAEYKPTINVENLEGNIQRVEEMTADALQFFNTTRMIVVYYEDLVKDPKIVSAVQKFIGVPARDLASKQVKIHTKPLQDQIENWEELLTRFEGTQYEKFLDDEDYV